MRPKSKQAKTSSASSNSKSNVKSNAKKPRLPKSILIKSKAKAKKTANIKRNNQRKGKNRLFANTSTAATLTTYETSQSSAAIDLLFKSITTSTPPPKQISRKELEIHKDIQYLKSKLMLDQPAPPLLAVSPNVLIAQMNHLTIS